MLTYNTEDKVYIIGQKFYFEYFFDEYKAPEEDGGNMKY